MAENREARRIGEALERRGFAATPETISEIMTTKEAADYLRVAKQTLDKLRVYGGGPRFAKLTDTSTGAVRYRRSDLDAWLESRLISSTSEAA